MVYPVTLRIEGKNNKAPAINTKEIGVPIGTWVGLSLCCLNFIMAPIAKANPAIYEPPVIIYPMLANVLVIDAAIDPISLVAAAF
jgi:hypothetical protein